jgi:hypothetical protein
MPASVMTCEGRRAVIPLAATRLVGIHTAAAARIASRSEPRGVGDAWLSPGGRGDRDSSLWRSDPIRIIARVMRAAARSVART